MFRREQRLQPAAGEELRPLSPAAGLEEESASAEEEEGPHRERAEVEPVGDDGRRGGYVLSSIRMT
jgi:hypothetical protein